MQIPDELLNVAVPGSTFIETDSFIDAISPCGRMNFWYNKESQEIYRGPNRSVRKFMDICWDKNPRIMDMYPNPLEVY